MTKRFLNVQYDTLTAEVDITSMSRLGEVQDAIKAKLFLSRSVMVLFNSTPTATETN
jgi:hypothetical protein